MLTKQEVQSILDAKATLWGSYRATSPFYFDTCYDSGSEVQNFPTPSFPIFVCDFLCTAIEGTFELKLKMSPSSNFRKLYKPCSVNILVKDWNVNNYFAKDLKKIPLFFCEESGDNFINYFQVNSDSNFTTFIPQVLQGDTVETLSYNLTSSVGNFTIIKVTSTRKYNYLPCQIKCNYFTWGLHGWQVEEIV